MSKVERSRPTVTCSSVDFRACDFCLRIRDPDLRVAWWDFVVLHEQRETMVVAALAPIRPGHVLVVSKHHYHSFANASSAVGRSLPQALEAIRTAFGTSRLRIAEHGSGSGGVGGACISHAHVHVLPCLPGEEPLRLGPEWASYTGGAIVDDEEWGGRDYLFTADIPGQGWIRPAQPGDSRFIQRYLGRSDDQCRWDYVLSPRPEDVMRTIRLWTSSHPSLRAFGR